MNVHKIVMDRFMKHDQTSLELPERGVVLVTGENGAGKSALIEAVAVAYWGLTLRGAFPWRGAGIDGELRVETDLGWSQRTKRDTRVGLTWAPAGGDSSQYENTTKAQKALEDHVGSCNLWRRTHVFSSADAASFTMSTDGERKRFLEEILSLDCFDTALDRCRVDLRAAQSRQAITARDLSVLEERASGVGQRRTDAERSLASFPECDVPALEINYKRVCGLVESCNRDLSRIRETMREGDRKIAACAESVRQAKMNEATLCSDQCPMCQQDIPKALQEKLRHVLAESQEELGRAQEAHRIRAQEVLDELTELEEEIESLSGRRQSIAADLRSARDVQAARLAAAERLRVVLEEAEKVGTNVEKAREAAASVLSEVREGYAVETVLGLRGVRAHVLGQALAGVERVANVWLSRIADNGLSLRLRAYTEKKTGGVSDAISLEIDGAGGGHGYRAASGGERRRIDVALLLALSEIAHGARGGEKLGTLFMDEVFDALDRDGALRIVDVIGELSQDRAVVIITHNPELVGSLRPSLCVRVQNGSVDVRVP